VPVDAGGALGDYSNVVQVGEFIWHVKTLDTMDAIRGYTSLVVVNGKPAIALRGIQQRRLKVCARDRRQRVNMGNSHHVGQRGLYGRVLLHESS